MLGIVTSDMSKSGAFDRAAVSASSGLVKNVAENPFICSMVARVDAMTGSSSTTKIRVAGSDNT
jgi:allophanate hydrolase subunit 2